MELITIVVMVFFIAVIFSMLGLGGGTVYVPMFYWLGIDILIAIPTALLLNAVTSSSAAITYLRKRMVDLHTAAPFIIASTIGAPIGAYFTRFTPVETILWAFSVVLVITSVRMIFSETHENNNGILNLSAKKRTVIEVVLGFLIGITIGLLGIGGGVFIVPVLIALGFGMKRASATSGFIVIFASVSGFLGHLGTVHLDPDLIIYTAIAALRLFNIFGINESWYKIFTAKSAKDAKGPYFSLRALRSLRFSEPFQKIIKSLTAFFGAQVGSHLMYSKIRSKTIKQMFGVVLWIMAVKIVSGPAIPVMNINACSKHTTVSYFRKDYI